MDVQCVTCKKNFKKPRCHGNRTKTHYCNLECYYNRIIEREIFCCGCKKEIDRSKKRTSKKLCSACYKREYKKKHPEAVEKARKYSLERYRKKLGLPKDHPFLKNSSGSGYIGKNGYRTIYRPDHANTKNSAGQVHEHTVVMSEFLGRPLLKGENVHHKNGIRHDNRIENLELWDRSHPPGQRVEDKILFYKEFLEQYGYKVTKA